MMMMIDFPISVVITTFLTNWSIGYTQISRGFSFFWDGEVIYSSQVYSKRVVPWNKNYDISSSSSSSSSSRALGSGASGYCWILQPAMQKYTDAVLLLVDCDLANWTCCGCCESCGMVKWHCGVSIALQTPFMMHRWTETLVLSPILQQFVPSLV